MAFNVIRIGLIFVYDGNWSDRTINILGWQFDESAWHKQRKKEKG